MKEYYGFISFSGRVAFKVKAESEEQAKSIVFNDLEGLDINTRSESPLEVEYVEWELIDQEARGNVKDAFINDFEIYEEKDTDKKEDIKCIYCKHWKGWFCEGECIKCVDSDKFEPKK